ncbi:UNVERIFIED_CONTAM: hypothetical protein HHA_316470 [Hammondia hammondi]|eukprot:XP_008883319.1 hypothetical protein HHA_316470 [Hammondia hammondi]
MRSAKGGPAPSGTLCSSSIPAPVAPFLASCSPRFAKQLTDIFRRLSLPISTLQVEAIHRLLTLALEKESQAFPAHLQAAVALLFHTLRPQLPEALSPDVCTPQPGSKGGVVGSGRAAYLQQVAFLPSLDAAVALAGPAAVPVLSLSSLSSQSPPRSDVVFSAFPPLVGSVLDPGVACASVPAGLAAVRAAALSALVQLVSAGLLDLHRVTDEILASAAALERNRTALVSSPKPTEFPVRVDLTTILPEGLQRLLFASLLQEALAGRLGAPRVTAASSSRSSPPSFNTASSSLSPSQGETVGEPQRSLPSCVTLSEASALLSKTLQRLAAFDGHVGLSILEPLSDVLLACCASENAAPTACETGHLPLFPVPWAASFPRDSHSCSPGEQAQAEREEDEGRPAGSSCAARQNAPGRQRYEKSEEKGAVRACDSFSSLRFSPKTFRSDVLLHLVLPLLRDALHVCGAPESRSRTLAVDRLLAAAAACVEAERRAHACVGEANSQAVKPARCGDQRTGLGLSEGPPFARGGDSQNGKKVAQEEAGRTERRPENAKEVEEEPVGLLLRFIFQELHNVDPPSGFLSCWDAAHRVLKLRCTYTPSDEQVGLGSQLAFALLHRACLERQSGRDATLILRRFASWIEEAATTSAAQTLDFLFPQRSDGKSPERVAQRAPWDPLQRSESVWRARLLACSLGWLLWQFPSESELGPLLHACSHLLSLLASLSGARKNTIGGGEASSSARAASGGGGAATDSASVETEDSQGSPLRAEQQALFSSHLVLLVPLLSLQQTCPRDSPQLSRVAWLADAAASASRACLQAGAEALCRSSTPGASPRTGGGANCERSLETLKGVPGRLGRAAGGHLLPWLTAALWLFHTIDRPLVELTTRSGTLRSSLSFHSYSSTSLSPPHSSSSHSLDSTGSVKGGDSQAHLFLGSLFSGDAFSKGLSPLVFARDHGLISLLLSVLLLSEFPQHRAHACKGLLATLQAQPLEAQRALPVLHFAAAHLPLLPLLASLRAVSLASLPASQSENRERQQQAETHETERQKADRQETESEARQGTTQRRTVVERAHRDWQGEGSMRDIPHRPAAGSAGVAQESEPRGTVEAVRGQLESASILLEEDSIRSSLCSCAAVSAARFSHFLGAAARASWDYEGSEQSGVERGTSFSGLPKACAETPGTGGRAVEAERRMHALAALWRVQQVAVVALMGHVLAALPADKYLVPPAYRALLDISGYSGPPPASCESSCFTSCSVSPGDCPSRFLERSFSCPVWAPLAPSLFTPALRACLLHPLLTRLFVVGELSPSKLLLSPESSALFPLFTFCSAPPALTLSRASSALASLSSLSLECEGPATADTGQRAVSRAMLLAVQDIARGSFGFACTGAAAPLLQHALPQIQLALEAETATIRAQAVDLLSLFCLAGVLCPGKVKRILEKKNLLNLFQQPPEITRAVACFLRAYIVCLLHASADPSSSASSSSDVRVASLSAEEEAKVLEVLGLLEEICQLGACARARSVSFLGASLVVPALYDAEDQTDAVCAREEASLSASFSRFSEQKVEIPGGASVPLERWRPSPPQGLAADTRCFAQRGRQTEQQTTALPQEASLSTCRFLTPSGLASLFLLPLSLASVRGAALALAAAMQKERGLLGRRRAEGATHASGRSRCMLRILRTLREKRERAAARGSRPSSSTADRTGGGVIQGEEVVRGDGKRREASSECGEEERGDRGGAGNVDGENAVISMVLLEEHKADLRRKGSGAATERLLADRQRAAFLAQIKAAASTSRLQHPLLLPLFPHLWRELLIEYMESLPSSESRLMFSRDGRLSGGKNRACTRELESLFEAIAPCLLNSSSRLTQQRPPQFAAFSSFLASLALVHPALASRAVQTLQRCLFVDAVEDTRETPDWIVSGCLLALSSLHGASITVPDFFPMCCFLLRDSSSAATQGTVFVAASADARAHPTDKVELLRLLQLYVHLGRHASCAEGEAVARRRIRALKAEARRRGGDAEEEPERGEVREERSSPENPNLHASASQGVSENALDELEDAVWSLPLETLPLGWFLGLACVARLLHENVPDPTVFFSFFHHTMLRLEAAFFGYHKHRPGLQRNKRENPSPLSTSSFSSFSSSASSPDAPVSHALLPLSTLVPALLESGVLSLRRVCDFLSSLASFLALASDAVSAVCWFAVAHLVRSLSDFLTRHMRTSSPFSSQSSSLRGERNTCSPRRMCEALLRLHDLLVAWLGSSSSVADRGVRALAVAALAGVHTPLGSPGKGRQTCAFAEGLESADGRPLHAVGAFLRRLHARLQREAGKATEQAHPHSASQEPYGPPDAESSSPVLTQDEAYNSTEDATEDAADDGWGERGEEGIPSAIAQFLEQLEASAAPLVRIQSGVEATPRAADPEGTFVLCQLYVQMRALARGGVRGSAHQVLPEQSLLRFAFDEVHRAARASYLPRFLPARQASRSSSSSEVAECTVQPFSFAFPSFPSSDSSSASSAFPVASSAAVCPPQTRTDHLQLAHLVALLEALAAVRPPLPDLGLHAPLDRLWWLAAARLEELLKPREVEQETREAAHSRRPGQRCTDASCRDERNTRKEDKELEEEVERVERAEKVEGRGRSEDVCGDDRDEEEEVEALWGLQIALLRVCGAHACNAPLLAQVCCSWASAMFFVENAGEEQRGQREDRERKIPREQPRDPDRQDGRAPSLCLNPEAPSAVRSLARTHTSSPPCSSSLASSLHRKAPMSRAVKFVFLAELPSLLEALPRSEAVSLLTHIFTRGLEGPQRAPKLWCAALFALKRVLLAFLDCRDAAAVAGGGSSDRVALSGFLAEEEQDESLRQIEQLLGQWLLPRLSLDPVLAQPAGNAAAPCGVPTPEGAKCGAVGRRGMVPFAVLAHLAEALEVLLVAKKTRSKTRKSEASDAQSPFHADCIEGVSHLPVLVLGYLILKHVLPISHLHRLRDQFLLPPQDLSRLSSAASPVSPSLPVSHSSGERGEGASGFASLETEELYLPCRRDLVDRELVSFAFVAASLPWPEQLEILHGVVCSVSVRRVSVQRVVHMLVAFALFATAPHLAVLLLDPVLDGLCEGEKGEEGGRMFDEAATRSRFPVTGDGADEEISRETKLREPECLYTSDTGIRWLMDQQRAERVTEEARSRQRSSSARCLSSSSFSSSFPDTFLNSCLGWEEEESVTLQSAVSPEESGLFPSVLQIIPRAFLGVRSFFAFHFSPNLPHWQSLLLHAPSQRPSLLPPSFSALSLPPATALALSYGQQDAALLLKRREKLFLRLHLPSSLLFSLSPSLTPDLKSFSSAHYPSSPPSPSCVSGELRASSSLESVLRLAAPFALRELRMLLVKSARLQKELSLPSAQELGLERKDLGRRCPQKAEKTSVDVLGLLRCFDDLLASPSVSHLVQL